MVRKETPHLLAVARRVVRNEEDAQDAVQQAFLSAFRSLPTFNGQSRLTTWLHRIVTNAALMRLRTRGRRPEDSIEDLLPTFREEGTTWSSSVKSLPADARMVRRETRKQVRAAIERCPIGPERCSCSGISRNSAPEQTAQALGVIRTR